MRPRGRRPTGATSGSVKDGDVSRSGPRNASITRYGSGKPDALVAEGMAPPKTSRDTLRPNTLDRTMSAAASGRGSASEPSWAMRLCSAPEQPRTRVVRYSIQLNPLPVRGSEPGRLPVASRIARRDVAVVEPPDRLAAPELVVVVDDDQLMAALPQPVQCVRR